MHIFITSSSSSSSSTPSLVYSIVSLAGLVLPKFTYRNRD